MLGALTNRTPVTGDALPRAARLHAAAGHERHSCGELYAPWLSAPFAINILRFTTEVKQCIPFSPPCDCSYELKITFCVRGVISPLISNVYLNEIDKMLERAKEVTRYERWTAVEYARFADDVVILVDGHPRQQWLRQAVEQRLREELAKLQVEVNEDKSRKVDLQRGECFGFLGFEFRRILSRRGRWMPLLLPKGKKRTALLGKLKEIFRASRSQPVGGVIAKINPILRGWVKYFAIGHSSRCSPSSETG